MKNVHSTRQSLERVYGSSGFKQNSILRITVHDPEELHVRRVGSEVFLVALRTRLAGNYAGTPFSGVARYTRVWSRETGHWLIVGGHVSMTPDNAA